MGGNAMLNELADRVEAAVGPDRELDNQIGAMLNTGRRTDPRNPGYPHYTTFMDEAVQLLPDGSFWGVIMDGDDDGFQACCEQGGTSLIWHKAATPALALCAAALRARKDTPDVDR
jgi:hypothetical protein